jgi:8-oxo-dGTP pyrophosphatase MutT (NUDIX family)
MKRNPNIIFGGVYAFSGGKVEPQDHYDYWTENYNDMIKTLNRKFYDFNARICAIRETFEEINFLIYKRLDHTPHDHLTIDRKEYE